MSTNTSSDDRAQSERPSLGFLAVAWLFLVVVAVMGRSLQPGPGWNITPMVAVALAAGALFPSAILAASVPVVALAIGNIFLPPYDHPLIAVVTYAGFTSPVLFGHFGLLRNEHGGTRWGRVVACAAIPSLLMYPIADATHWYVTDMYPKSLDGFIACLVAGVPFYRWAPVGDIAWSLGVFGLFAGLGYAASSMATGRLAPVSVAHEGSRLTGGDQG